MQNLDELIKARFVERFGDNIYLNSTKEHIIHEGVKKNRLVKSGSLIFANCGVSLGFARDETQLLFDSLMKKYFG